MYSTGTGTGAHHDICVSLKFIALNIFPGFVILWMCGGATMPKTVDTCMQAE